MSAATRGFAPGRDVVDSRPVVCVDLDSTLCDTRHRQPMVVGRDPATVDWVEYSMCCSGDAPVTGVCALVRILAARYRIVILSARDRAATRLTERWLADNGVPYDDLVLGTSLDTGGSGGMGGFKVQQVKRMLAAGRDVSLFIDDNADITARIAAIGVAVITVQPPTIAAGADAERTVAASEQAAPAPR